MAHLKVDGKEVQTWELLQFEGDIKIGNVLLIFARYLADDDGKLISPGLPSSPIDELSGEDLAKIRNSEAYRALKRFPVADLMTAAKSFAEQAAAGVSPK